MMMQAPVERPLEMEHSNGNSSKEETQLRKRFPQLFALLEVSQNNSACMWPRPITIHKVW